MTDGSAFPLCTSSAPRSVSAVMITAPRSISSSISLDHLPCADHFMDVLGRVPSAARNRQSRGERLSSTRNLTRMAAAPSGTRSQQERRNRQAPAQSRAFHNIEITRQARTQPPSPTRLGKTHAPASYLSPPTGQTGLTEPIRPFR